MPDLPTYVFVPYLNPYRQSDRYIAGWWADEKLKDDYDALRAALREWRRLQLRRHWHKRNRRHSMNEEIMADHDATLRLPSLLDGAWFEV